ncbi:MAG: Ig-like domain-containing protein, partial [Myxococcota bacterium]
MGSSLVMVAALGCSSGLSDGDSTSPPLAGPTTEPGLDDNTPPIARSDSSTVRFGSTRTIDVLGNDLDPDGDALTVVSVTRPFEGEARIESDGTVVYEHSGDPGTDTFDYVVSDERGQKAQQTVTLDVLLPPSLTFDTPSDGATVQAGDLEVQLRLSGCFPSLDPDLGCQIALTLDGMPLPLTTVRRFVLDNSVNGPRTLAATLTAPDGTPLEPRVETSTTWTSTGGREAHEYPWSASFFDPQAMQDFCADGYTAVLGDVVISSPLVTDTDALDCLARVDGDLGILGTRMTSVRLPALKTVGGFV